MQAFLKEYSFMMVWGIKEWYGRRMNASFKHFSEIFRIRSLYAGNTKPLGICLLLFYFSKKTYCFLGKYWFSVNDVFTKIGRKKWKGTSSIKIKFIRTFYISCNLNEELFPDRIFSTYFVWNIGLHQCRVGN